MKQGQDEYFAVIGEGAALLMNLGEQSPGFFDDLNRLREILAILGYASAVGPLQFSLADKAGSLAALSEYVNNGIKLLPNELALYELLTVRDLSQLVGGDYSSLSEALWEYQNVLNRRPDESESKLAAFNALAARGVKHGISQEKLLGAVEASEALWAKKVGDDSEYAKVRAQYEEVTAAGQAAIREQEAKSRDASARYRQALLEKREDDAVALKAEREYVDEELERIWKDARLKQAHAWDLVGSVVDKFNTDRAEQARTLFAETGEAIIAKVAEASPITQEQADAWAAEQVIDPSAKAKLKKLGYPLADVVRDMAEFYRLSGGKASAIRIGLDGGKRANATGISERLGEKVINLGSRFNKTVLFHELAHFLEGDGIAKAAANGFLLKRRESDQPHTLRSLTGNKAYDAREIAYKDGFMDPYVGKIYSDGITEVWAMGVQYLANPKDAAIFAAKDPEMFALITGYLTMQTTPAMHAKLNMHKSAIGELQEKKQTEEVMYERAVALLSGKAKLAHDNWFDSLDSENETRRLLETYILYKVKKDRAVYVGSHGPYRVFSGVFRNRATKRASKGHVIVDIRVEEDTEGSFFRRNIPDHEVVHGGIDVVQASIALAERDGTGLFRAISNYFVDSWGGGSRKKNLIETVGAENLQ